MKMDPRDTVKLRASLVTRQDTEMYSGSGCTAGERGGVGWGVIEGGKGRKEGKGGPKMRARQFRLKDN